MINSRWTKWVLGAVCALGLQVSAFSEERATRDEAKAMTDAAVEHTKKVGAEQAFKDFTDQSNKDWHKKDLYVYAANMNGVVMAHGANEKLLGKNLLEMKDPNGKLYVHELIAVAQKGGGWVEYDWPHPQTKKVESKVSYVRKLANYEGFAAVGTYR